MSSYPYYPLRTVNGLDGSWEFCWLGDAEPENVDFSGLTFDELAAVPGVYDTAIDRYGVRGLGVYRKIVRGFPKGRTRLSIGGMGLYAKVLVNGVTLDDYKLPYSAVDYDFDLSSDSIEVVIAVDNRMWKKDRIPLFDGGYDFYGFGGIYRSVSLMHLSDTRIERVVVSTLESDTGLVKLRIVCGGNILEFQEFTLSFDGGASRAFRERVVNGEITLELNVPDFKLWSPESPNLHTVEVRTGDDRIVERFGIRTIQTRGQDILLNGKKIYLRGLNRHESHPEMGPVQNTQLILDDLRALRDLGCNYIRTVHYQQSQELLDLCDEMGFMVWEETIGWGIHDPAVLCTENAGMFLEQNRRMVRRGINNPSIIIWSFLNECGNGSENSEDFYTMLVNDIRREDPTRLVSYCSWDYTKPKCLALCDIISRHFYPGWIANDNDYSVKASHFIASCIDYYIKWAESKEETRNKPLIVSEIGACGLYGVHDRDFAPWSEEFQADYMKCAAEVIFATPRITGLTLWQMFDTKSFTRGSGIRGKARGFNCAGLLDEYRRPKLAYDAVRRVYRAHAGKES